jgi:hypothetical protein
MGISLAFAGVINNAQTAPIFHTLGDTTGDTKFAIRLETSFS